MKKESKEVWFSIFLLIGDAIVIALAFLFSFFLRFKSSVIPITKGIPSNNQVLMSIIVLVLMSIFIFGKNELYKLRNTKNFLKIAELGTLIIAAFMSFTFIFREVSDSRILFLIYWPVSIIMLYISRCIWFFILNASKMMPIREVLYIGDEKNYKRLKSVFDASQEYKITKYVHYLKINELKDIENADEIVFDLPPEQQNLMLQVMNKFGNKVDYKIVPTELDVVTRKVNPEEIGGAILLNVKKTPLKGINIFIKRLFDLIISFFLLMILSPFLGAIAVMIKAESKGPVIYKQERIGQNKKIFTMYKFRSMVDDAERKTGPVWAKEDDARMTKIGRWIRKRYLDELAQLWNVLKGDMSLVGPRPERPTFVEQFKEEVPRYIERHLLKSGMTGWAQVNGYTGNTSLRERINLDLYYIENWSLWLDIKIILRTAKNMVTKKDA